MQYYASTQPGAAPFKGVPTVWASLGLFVAALVTAVPVYAGWLSGSLAFAYRFGMPLLWGVLALAVASSPRLKPFSPLPLSLFGVSLGFALAYIIGDRPLDWFGLSWTTPQGAAPKR